MDRTKWSLIVILFIIAGCDSSRLFEENQDLVDRVWLANDIRTFPFTVNDTSETYNIYFNVRNTMEYPHYNLYLSYRLKDSLQNTLVEELKNIDLFDPKSGESLGPSALGDIFDHQIILLENYDFETPGTKFLEFQQFMRYDSLPELVSLGVRIEKTTQRNR